MNILTFELKRILPTTLVWTAVTLAVLFAFAVGVYPLFSQGVDSVMKMMDQMPPAMRAIFGLGAINFLTYPGYYSFIHEYISIIGSIMAVAISLSVFAREKRGKCMDFIMTRPVSRGTIFFQKAMAVLVGILFLNLCYIPCSILLFGQHAVGNRGILASFALLFTQLFFAALGVCIATFFKKIRSISGLATAIGFGAFILSALENLIGEDWMTYIAPLHFFSPSDALLSGHFTLGTILWATVLTIGAMAASAISFFKKDVHAV